MEEGKLPNALYEASIILILKPDEDLTQKKTTIDPHHWLTDEEIPKIMAKHLQTIYQKDHSPQSHGIYSQNARMAWYSWNHNPAYQLKEGKKSCDLNRCRKGIWQDSFIANFQWGGFGIEGIHFNILRTTYESPQLSSSWMMKNSLPARSGNRQG